MSTRCCISVGDERRPVGDSSISLIESSHVLGRPQSRADLTASAVRPSPPAPLRGPGCQIRSPGRRYPCSTDPTAAPYAPGGLHQSGHCRRHLSEFRFYMRTTPVAGPVPGCVSSSAEALSLGPGPGSGSGRPTALGSARFRALVEPRGCRDSMCQLSAVLSQV